MSFSFPTNPRVSRRKFCADDSLARLHTILLSRYSLGGVDDVTRACSSSHQVNPPVVITTLKTAVIQIMIKVHNMYIELIAMHRSIIGAGYIMTTYGRRAFGCGEE